MLDLLAQSIRDHALDADRIIVELAQIQETSKRWGALFGGILAFIFFWWIGTWDGGRCLRDGPPSGRG